MILSANGAPDHTSGEITGWLYERCNFLLFWPASSPNFSLIESFRWMMEKLLRWQPIGTVWELAQALQEVWTHIELAMVTRLANDFGSGCNSV
jgi:hypothetical protein